jgi:hypothetical protein
MMTIKNGKFFKDGVQVPIEHGNKEQIKLMKQVEEMTLWGFTPEITIVKSLEMHFKCICGAFNHFNDFTKMDEADDPDYIIEGEKDKCFNCGLEYKVIVDNESDGLMLKLMPKVVKKLV